MLRGCVSSYAWLRAVPPCIQKVTCGQNTLRFIQRRPDNVFSHWTQFNASAPLLTGLVPRCHAAGALMGTAALSNTYTTAHKTQPGASASQTDPAKAPQDPESGKPNKTQQLKKVFKEYGAVAVGFHVSISLVSLGICYLAISSGINVTALLFRLGFSEAVVQSKMAAGTSTFVLAYAVHKLFAPVRISVTLVSVPLIVRYFRKTGLFKPPASSR